MVYVGITLMFNINISQCKIMENTLKHQSQWHSIVLDMRALMLHTSVKILHLELIYSMKVSVTQLYTSHYLLAAHYMLPIQQVINYLLVSQVLYNNNKTRNYNESYNNVQKLVY